MFAWQKGLSERKTLDSPHIQCNGTAFAFLLLLNCVCLVFGFYLQWNSVCSCIYIVFELHFQLCLNCLFISEDCVYIVFAFDSNCIWIRWKLLFYFVLCYRFDVFLIGNCVCKKIKIQINGNWFNDKPQQRQLNNNNNKQRKAKVNFLCKSWKNIAKAE